MTTPLRTFALIALVAIAIGACSSAGAPSAPSSSDPAASLDPNAADAPAVSTDSGDGPILDPAGGQVVVPKPGQLDVRPIAAQTLTAAATGRRVVVSVAYTSGVEPCNVLDSIVVRTGPQAFEITLREGHGPGDVACIEIAQYKRAMVDLGELEPGTYRITDGTGGAAPISVTVA